MTNEMCPGCVPGGTPHYVRADCVHRMKLALENVHKAWKWSAEATPHADPVQAPADTSLADERAFWASKFEHWAKCQESGGSWAMRKADGFKDCAKVLRENDRWVPPGVETTRPDRKFTE